MILPVELHQSYQEAILAALKRAYPNSEGKLVFVGVTGSRAYGTNRPDSDYDIRGCYIPPMSDILGLRHSERVNITDKPVEDGMLFSLSHLFNMLLNGNPNVLELLFLPKECLLGYGEAWNTVLSRRDLFVTKKVADSFFGYATSQFKRMTHVESTRELGEKRKANVVKFGYDPKQAMNVIRLCRMGKELLLTGTMSVQRPEAEFLKEILAGKLNMARVTAQIQAEMDELKKAESASKLPAETNFEQVNQLHQCLVLESFGVASHAQLPKAPAKQDPEALSTSLGDVLANAGIA